MKFPRISIGRARRQGPRSLAVPMRSVRAMLATAFSQAEQGACIDYADLTDEKLLWRRNRLQYTEQFDNAVWIKVNGGTGSVPVVTPNYSAAPNGTMTASRLQMAINGGTTTADISSILQSLQLAPRGTFVSQGVWLKTNDGTTKVVQWRDDNAQTVAKLITVTPAWQQFTQEGATANTHDVNAIRLWLRGTQGTADSADLSIWGAQCVFGPVLGDYQRMTDIATEFMAAFPLHALYQDDLGTQPVYLLEQSIGLALDMRFGGLRGAQLFSDAGITLTGGASRVSSGVYRLYSADGSLSKVELQGVLTVGKFYTVEFNIDSVTAANGGIALDQNGVTVATFTGVGKKFLKFTASFTAWTLKRVTTTGATDYQISGISVNEVPGNHAKQPTAGDRPFSDARINRLTFSEFLVNGAWSKLSGLTVVDNTDLGPNNISMSTLTGVAATTTYLQQKDIPVWANSQAWVSCFVKAGSSPASMLAVYNNAISTAICRVVINWTSGVASLGALGGVWATNPTIEATAIAGVYRVQGQLAVGSNTAIAVLYYPSAGNAAETSKVGGFQLTNGGPAFPRYQRIITSTEYDAIGFPKGARFNGSNSWMSVGGMDLSGSDKVGVVVAGRKDADTTTGMLLEYTADTAANNGSFGIRSPQSAAPTYGFAARGAAATSGADAGKQTSASFPAPHMAVLSCSFDLAQADYLTQIQPQVNGVTPALNAMGLNAAGNGNFANSVLYIARRAGSAFPHSGVIYRIGVRSGSTDNTLGILRRWANDPIRSMA